MKGTFLKAENKKRGYYGSGRRGGEVAQFLVGLADRPDPNAYPRRVGTGLADDELEAVVNKLKPYFRSIILSINSDIRTIRSEVFAAPYSLRFPPFVELVHSSNGTTQKGTVQGDAQDGKSRHKEHTRKAEKKAVSILQQEVDEYSDPYYWDLDLADIKQLLNNIQRSENANTIDYYRKKYCPKESFEIQELRYSDLAYDGHELRNIFSGRRGYMLWDLSGWRIA
ncbi:hypothetical protein QQP08_025429 [Theobroma cacao]|nr:hypothetical protein QQP08_025429 [Theobroma cacao]